jgi:hypothetical protein
MQNHPTPPVSRKRGCTSNPGHSLLGRQGNEVIGSTDKPEPVKRRQLAPNMTMHAPTVHTNTTFADNGMIDFTHPLPGPFSLGNRPIALPRTSSGHVIVEQQDVGGWYGQTQARGAVPFPTLAHPGPAAIHGVQQRPLVPNMAMTNFRYPQPQSLKQVFVGGQQPGMVPSARQVAPQSMHPMQYAPQMPYHNLEPQLAQEFTFGVSLTPAPASVQAPQPRPQPQRVYHQPTNRGFTQQTAGPQLPLHFSNAARPAPQQSLPPTYASRHVSHPRHNPQQNAKPRPPPSLGFSTATKPVAQQPVTQQHVSPFFQSLNAGIGDEQPVYQEYHASSCPNVNAEFGDESQPVSQQYLSPTHSHVNAVSEDGHPTSQEYYSPSGPNVNAKNGDDAQPALQQSLSPARPHANTETKDVQPVSQQYPSPVYLDLTADGGDEEQSMDQLPTPPSDSTPAGQEPERELTEEELNAILEAWAEKIGHVSDFGGERAKGDERGAGAGEADWR